MGRISSRGSTSRRERTIANAKRTIRALVRGGVKMNWDRASQSTLRTAQLDYLERSARRQARKSR